MSDDCSAFASAPVLLVDDEPDQVEMYDLALHDAGFSTIAAYNGLDALRRAEQFQPSVIVLDVRLPDISGWHVCQALKANPRTSHIPVILLTAAASHTLGTEAQTAGCAACLVKPCFPDQLIDAIRQVTRVPQP